MQYVISYDLDAPGKNYKKLTDELVRLGATRILLSQWVARRTGTTATGLRDHVWQFMDANDRLLVTSLGSADWAGRNLMADPNAL